MLDDADSVDRTATLLLPSEEGPLELQVRIGDEDVGTLTEATTARHLALVQRVLDAGFPATCAAKIMRRRHGPAVAVRLPRPDDPT